MLQAQKTLFLCLFSYQRILAFALCIHFTLNFPHVLVAASPDINQVKYF